MLFAHSTQSAHLAQEIDRARCQGHWHLVPDLVKRYVRQHPEGVEEWEQLLLAEVQLVQLVKDARTVEAHEAQGIKSQLDTVLTTSKASAQVKECAKVVLARLLFVCREYRQAAALAHSIRFEQQIEGYTLILCMQAKTVQAMCLEQLGDFEACLRSYDSLAMLLLDHMLPVQDAMVLEWLEEALPGSTQQRRQLLLCHHRLTSHQPFSWQLARRRELTCALLQHLSEKNDDDDDDDDRDDRLLQLQLYTLYEKLVNKSDGTQDLEMFVEMLARDLPRLARSVDDLHGFKQVVERAKQFNLSSACLVRHHLTILYYLGEYQEAHHAILAYLSLAGIVRLSQWHDDDGQGKACFRGRQGQAIPEPRSPVSCSFATKSTNESIDKQAHVLLIAMQLYHSLDQPSDAVDMANLALDLLAQHGDSPELVKFNEKSSNIAADLYRTAGAAYGWLATQAFDSERRALLHEKALALLQQAITTAPDSFQAHYQLGYQHASMRNICNAITSAKCALKLRPMDLGSWHLLILTLSCPGQGVSHETVLNMADKALQHHDSEANSSSFERLCANWQEERHTQRLALAMTHNRLVRACHGARDALEQHPTLFKKYGHWCRRHAGASVIDDNDAFPQLSTSVLGGDWHQHGAARAPTSQLSTFGNLPEFMSQSHVLVLPHAKPSRKSSVRSSHSSHTMAASPSISSMDENSRSFRRRSASSGTIRVSEPVMQPLAAPEAAESRLLRRGSSSLRKHSSNSMLRTTHYWHGLFPSRSSSRRSFFALSAVSSSPTPTHASNDTAYMPSNLEKTKSADMPFISLLQPTRLTPHWTTHVDLQRKRQQRWVARLWRLAADMYECLDQHDDALHALFEAECVCPGDDADLWCQMARMAHQPPIVAQRLFEKGLFIDPLHVGCHVGLATLHVAQGDIDLAQGLLQEVTQAFGWACPEAWYQLGCLHKEHLGDMAKAKACLLYALDLAETEPIQPFELLPRLS
ncbi:hypothetical protein BC940DRAFT_329035 [Gongronella butleri]|nr:hypothetical protein BC940DRAFT_329035 [Gongronella butleri]